MAFKKNPAIWIGLLQSEIRTSEHAMMCYIVVHAVTSPNPDFYNALQQWTESLSAAAMKPL